MYIKPLRREVYLYDLFSVTPSLIHSMYFSSYIIFHMRCTYTYMLLHVHFPPSPSPSSLITEHNWTTTHFLVCVCGMCYTCTHLLLYYWCCFPLLAGKGSRSKRSKVEESSESSTTETSSSSSDESSSESESSEEEKKKRRRRKRKKRQRKMKQLSQKEERKRKKKRKREGKDKKSKGRAKKRKQESERLVHILQQCMLIPGKDTHSLVPRHLAPVELSMEYNHPAKLWPFPSRM